MGTYKAKCDICYTENEVPTYGDWTCSECHQPYEYDEGHRIHLTDAQLEWLRQGRITDEERDAIAEAMRQVVESDCIATPHALEVIGTLRGLLERMK
jgi:hypothetical protein